jgi:hypothetical protein
MVLGWILMAISTGSKSARIGRGARAWGCVGLHKLDTKWLGKMGVCGLGMCRPT